MAKQCPLCGLFNTDVALRCDCGFDFESRHVEASYARPNDPEIAAERGMTIAQVGVRHIKLGAGIMAIGAVLFAAYAVAGHVWFPGLVAVVGGASLALRGVGQYRRGKRLEQERALTTAPWPQERPD